MQQELVDATGDQAIEAGASVIGVRRARELVRHFAEVTASKDVDAFVAGFTEDCVVQFGRFREMRGKEALRRFTREMFSERLQDFTCRKTLRSLSGNVLGVTWISEWTDGKTRQRKKGRGFEFWIMSGERIARWDAAFNPWD